MITKTETLEDNPPAGGKKEEKDEEETKLKKKISKKDSPMAKLLNDSPNPPEVGDLVEVL